MSKDKKPIKLGDIPKKDVFSTPEGYFDTLQDKIDSRIESKPEAKVVSMPLRWYVGLAAAATLTLLVVFMPAWFTSDTTKTAEQLLAEISDEDCLLYLQNTELEVEDMLELPEPELWNDAVDDMQSAPEISDEDAELLYEQYGVSPDESLQLL
jgi:hypothetical protein